MNRPARVATRPLGAGLLAVVALMAAAGFSPARGEGTDRPLSLRATGIYRVWVIDSGDETTIWQARAPFHATGRLHPKVELLFSGATVLNRLEPEGGRSESLDGIVDGSLQLFVRLAGDHVLLRGGAFLPNGGEADSSELALARLLAHPVLGFRSRQMSRGLDGHAGITLALPLASSLRLGAGAGHTARGAYVLVEGADEYEPASETVVTAGLELGATGASASFVRFDAAWRTFGIDRQGDLDLFEEGDQLEFQLSTRLGHEDGPMMEAAARLVEKEDNRILGPDGGEPAEFSPGTWLRGHASLSSRLGRRVRFGLAGEWTRMNGHDQPPAGGMSYDGTSYGGGPFIGFLLGDRFRLTIGGSILGGILDETTESPEMDLRGVQTTVTFTWRGGA